MSKFIIDDGFSPELIERAMFDGVFEIPLIHRNDETIIPSGLIPYSRRNTAGYNDCFLMFYENDVCFRDIFVAPDKMLTLARQYKGVISPDCSLYWDMPLALQIYNTYRNRQFGCFLQENGVYVIPNVRWGDERSYSQIIAGDKPFAFAGVEPHSTVAIGTYGCCKSKEEKVHLKGGLEAMIEILSPENVLVYGAMPSNIFDEFKCEINFIHFLDWTRKRHEEVENGNR